jgi:hypothetical protein
MNAKLNHCIFCGEPTGILLETCNGDRDSICVNNSEKWNKAPDKIAVSDEPCNECMEKMNAGFAFIERDTELDCNTGSMWVITLESAKEIIEPEFLNQCADNKCYITKEYAIKTGLTEL